MNDPIPSFEWIITHKCNYNCPYCCQSKSESKHCSDDIIDAVYNYLPAIEGGWLIKLIGGEPFIHPRFFEICKNIIKNGHELCTTTNFSCSMDKLEQLIEICGDNLNYITASLHVSQIKSVEKFIKKAIIFNSIKNSKTEFTVTSVVTEQNFDTLKEIENRLRNEGVKFNFQILKDGKHYTEYPLYIENYISDKLISNAKILRNKCYFGTICYTGKLFFKIDIKGNVTRCYNYQPFFNMGNLANGTFQQFAKPKPCLSLKCTCTVPANRNMIRYGRQSQKFNLLNETVKGLINNLKFRLN